MNIFRTAIILLLLVSGFYNTYAQSYRFRTTGYSTLQKNEKGKWGQWSDLNAVDVLMVLDTDKNRIVVYAQEIQLFNIVDYIATEENDTDIVYSFICKDNDGTDCKISIITRKMQQHRKQFYINYDNRILVYNIFNAR